MKCVAIPEIMINFKIVLDRRLIGPRQDMHVRESQLHCHYTNEWRHPHSFLGRMWFEQHRFSLRRDPHCLSGKEWGSMVWQGLGGPAPTERKQ